MSRLIDDARLQRELNRLTGWARFRAFTWLKMPSAAFVGLRLDKVDDESCETSISGGWRSQNPFKTMYWAAQGMAAELATGVYPFAASQASQHGLRMFVIGTEAEFVKRAKGRIRFVCEDIAATRAAIDETLASGESVDIDLAAIGYDSEGEIVSRWVFKWNFRAREKR